MKPIKKLSYVFEGKITNIEISNFGENSVKIYDSETQRKNNRREMLQNVE